MDRREWMGAALGTALLAGPGSAGARAAGAPAAPTETLLSDADL